MRLTVQSTDLASDLASIVLPTPGTSSMRRWPSASSTVRAVCDRVVLAVDDGLDVRGDLLGGASQLVQAHLVGVAELGDIARRDGRVRRLARRVAVHVSCR